jgi:hypothetical protein
VIATSTLGTYFSGFYPETVASSLVFAVGVGWLNADLLPLALAPVSKELARPLF